MNKGLRVAMVLEAMRLGVVPSANLSGYTVGRDEELAQVDRDLARASREGGAVRAFLADYGVGKTHLLEMVQQRAAEANFLTARVVLDASDSAPSHPKRVYRSLVRSLRYPEQPLTEGRGLRPLLEMAARDEDVLKRFDVDGSGTKRTREARLAEGMHLYLTPALQYFARLMDLKTAGKVDEAERAMRLLLDWLEGHPTISNQDIDQEMKKLKGRSARIYSLKDYRPWARIYGYLISGLATLARSVGYGGLVILLDEAELYSLLSSENRGYARVLFKALSCASLGVEQVPFERQELELGGYGVLQELPPRYGNAPSLYTVFAMTPNEEGMEILNESIPKDCISELSGFGADDYADLVSRVCGFYAESAQEWPLGDKLVGPLTSVVTGFVGMGYIANPRQAMKFVVEFLDVVRHEPSEVGRVVKGLQERLSF